MIGPFIYLNIKKGSRGRFQVIAHVIIHRPAIKFRGLKIKIIQVIIKDIWIELLFNEIRIFFVKSIQIIIRILSIWILAF